MTETDVAVAIPQEEARIATQPDTTPPPPMPEPLVRFVMEPEALKSFLAAASSLVDEVKLDVGPEGVTSSFVDAAHVAMMKIAAPAHVFADYLAAERSVVLELDKVKPFAKAIGKQPVHFRFEESTLVLATPTLSKTVALQDPESLPDPKTPTFELPNRCTVNAKAFLSALKQAADVSDHVQFTVVPGVEHDTLRVVGEGDADRTQAEFVLDRVGVREATKSLYNLDYLTKIVRAIPAKNDVALELGTDYPVRIRWVAHGILYEALLAPRIEAD